MTDCYCVLLRRASRRVTSMYDEVLAPVGINLAQFSLLRSIRRMQPVSLTDLGARLELDRSTIGRNTKVLERMGLVTTSPGADQREALLQLTEEGQAAVDKGSPLWDEAQRRIEEKIGDAAGELQTLLRKL
ncbi:MarR family winged helix-turn-helix transcriptional regulator [Rhizobiaceae bacterium n13]|uniref:MarR family winged helix-turn-helix transcriptional regulator n=1 Tax=Ferirhizobium litorale TaxID=2927786 RepID=A0AAE3TZ93_9HYPH|nr:MarR family winged helix-turn-helix transcriptional regulator [Fererhizobium litorale]MDI7860606.1 MarR family winged helix-turn-helix transcriptional regulator [Fererhizobium litorale]MDI7920754.1 MarR family winged helix-turn-helix transcriptional regulator [Fererhizobium litorale]